MIKNVKLSNPGAFFGAEVNIADRISDLIKIDHDGIHFSIENFCMIEFEFDAFF